MIEKVLSKLKKLFPEEDGSSMVEFALVLPMLIVLTIGGIYLSVSYSQKSLMNGLTFMQTRAATVRKEHTYIAKHAIDNYKETSGQVWVDKTKSKLTTDKPTNALRDLSVEMSSDAMNIDILANSLAVLSGEKPDNEKLRKIKTRMVLPIEYIVRGGGSDRPLTTTSVNYTTLPVGGSFIKEKFIGPLPDPIKEWVNDKLLFTVVDPKDDDNTHDTKKADKILGADPTYNMDKVNEIYDSWGLDRQSSSEEPLTQFGVNSLHLLRFTGNHIKVIETGSDLFKIIEQIGPVGIIVHQTLGVFKQIAGPGLMIAEGAGTNFAGLVENNNFGNFKE